tara:strand:+ start:196 stop:564 length:369 start_codon:yes stop_codon:yes gene_type:complete
MSWADDINTLVTKGGEDLDVLSRSIKIKLFGAALQDTRFLSGRLRGNWQIQENSPAGGELERTDKEGTIVQNEIMNGATSNGLTYFTNNLPYAKKFEDKDAMVGKNVARFEQIIKDLVKEIK